MTRAEADDDDDVDDGEVTKNLCSRLMVNRDPCLVRRREINVTERQQRRNDRSRRGQTSAR